MPEQQPVAVAPLVVPLASVDGWTLEGTALDGRIATADRRELTALLHCVSLRVRTPWTYERAAELLEANGQLGQALAATEAWFTLPEDVWRSHAGQTRMLDRRRQRLRSILHAQVAEAAARAARERAERAERYRQR